VALIELSVDSTQRLDTAVAGGVPEASRAMAARWIREGRVSVDARVAQRPGQRVEAGARLRVDIPPPAPSEAVAQDLPIRVVYEDEDVAVIDKEPGMVVHPAPGHPDGTLVNALLHHLDGLSTIGGTERPGLVHRLDVGTSGLLVVAKNDLAHRALSAQFAAHTAGRTYLAWVHDPPRADRGTADTLLARDPRNRQRYASTASTTAGKRAVTHWEVLRRCGRVGLVCCRLETGRTHQVRVHLSELGSPLLGDTQYPRRGASALPASLDGLVCRPMLHAWRLRFEHPRTGELVEHVAEPPEDFRRISEALGVELP
jgi:23S rRNA pseudouridine1911/1915/1917 synthase